MFSSLASYLWGAAEAQEPTDGTTAADSAQDAQPGGSSATGQEPDSPRLKTRPADNEWVLVDKTRKRSSANPKSSGRPKGFEPMMECSLGPLFKSPSPIINRSLGSKRGSDSSSGGDWLDNSLCMSQGLGYHGNQYDSFHSDILPGHHSDTAESDVSSLAERVFHPSMEESWLVTPPPCFTAGSSSSKRMETSSLENLLIEHPSMSVYSHRGRQSSTGVDSEGSTSETESPQSTEVGTRRGARRAGPARHEPPRRSHVLAARVGLTQVQLVKSMQKSQQRHLYKNLSSNRIMRSNIVREVGSQGSRKLRGHHVHQPTKRSHNNKQY